MIAQSDGGAESGTALSIAYFKQINEQAGDNYSLDCLVIAREIARRLLNEEKRPTIGMLVRFEMTEKGPHYDRLTPLKYNGRVTFTRHYVCCCDGVVFDPILDSPVAPDNYSELVFGLAIPLRTFIDTDRIEEYISVPKGYARANLQGDLETYNSGG